jgi:hypothetical protein
MANDSSDPLWSGWRDDVAHPQSPRGGGGPGRFRAPDTLNGASDPAWSSPHPASPVGRYHVPGFGDGDQRLAQRRRPAAPAAAPAARQPPPPTIPSTTQLPRQNTPARRVTVDVEVLADGSGSPARPLQGLTRINRDELWIDFPTYTLDSAEHVDRVSTPLVIRGRITIRTYYGPGARADGPAVYGRGTTADDEQAGSTTLGFHESCHREDLLRYFASHPFPTFRGRTGMMEREYLTAQTQFNEAIDRYFLDMDRQSRTVTDEVGYAQSQFDANGPRMQSSQQQPAAPGPTSPPRRDR